jgi:hypothetical protein
MLQLSRLSNCSNIAAQYNVRLFNVGRYHKRKEVEMALREWVRIKGPDFYCHGTFKLVPRDKRVNAL